MKNKTGIYLIKGFDEKVGNLALTACGNGLLHCLLQSSASSFKTKFSTLFL